MSTGGGLAGHRYGRNGEFCVTVALYQDCWHIGIVGKGAGHGAGHLADVSYARLIGLTLAGLKAYERR